MSEEIKALRKVVETMLGILPHVSFETGTCCCGDEMARHSDPMSSGHSPVDSGEYAVDQWRVEAEQLLAWIDAA